MMYFILFLHTDRHFYYHSFTIQNIVKVGLLYLDNVHSVQIQNVTAEQQFTHNVFISDAPKPKARLKQTEVSPVSIHLHYPSLFRLRGAIRLHGGHKRGSFSLDGDVNCWRRALRGHQCPGQQASALMGPSQASTAFLACLPGFPPPHYYLQSKQTSCSRRPKP